MPGFKAFRTRLKWFHMFLFLLSHRIGWWDNFQETPTCEGKAMVSCRLSLKPIHWLSLHIHQRHRLPSYRPTVLPHRCSRGIVCRCRWANWNPRSDRDRWTPRGMLDSRINWCPVMVVVLIGVCFSWESSNFRFSDVCWVRYSGTQVVNPSRRGQKPRFNKSENTKHVSG